MSKSTRQWHVPRLSKGVKTLSWSWGIKSPSGDLLRKLWTMMLLAFRVTKNQIATADTAVNERTRNGKND